MTENTPRACLLGHQIGYSRSPLIHRYWLRTLELDGSYDLVDIAPDDFADFFRNLRERGYVGANITKPHKAAAFRLIDSRDAAAEAIGAVNCVWYEGEHLVGGNTDASGYLASLDEQAPGWDLPGGLAVVIGAGGAGGAVAHALISRNLRVAVVNRTVTRAAELIGRFGSQVSAHAMTQLPGLLADAVLLTNTSSLGGPGQPPLDIDLTPLGGSAVVCDIVYVPLVTPLLRAARQRGHRTADGLGMLLHQAAPSFARWFGVTPPVTADLRTLAEADIRASTGG